MLLKSLRLHGFKTFAEKTPLLFDSGITVVVGPNGSGKSNISDSIRWVLGEQSVKTLRCAKMEDVIFNGTPTKRAQSFAEVELVIEDKEHKLGTDNDEITIKRRFHRSGDSEYFINQNQVRLKDVHELFMDTGLGRDGYSIISQGKIDSIVTSKSDSRREIFEEAAGISRFGYRKADAEKRLEQAKENILRLQDILKELEGRVGPLKEQSEKAKFYLSLAEEKKKLEIGVWVYTIEQSADVLKKHSEKISIARKQYEDIELELENISSQAEANFSKSNMCVSKIDEIRRSVSSLEESFSEKQNKISVFKNDISHNVDNVKRIQKDIEESSQSSESVRERINDRKLEIEKLNLSIEEKKKELGLHTSELESLQISMGECSQKANALSKELAELSLSTSTSNIKIVTSESTIKELLSRVSKINDELIQSNNNLNNMKLTLSDYEEKCNQAKEKVAAIENSLEGYKLKLESKKRKASEQKSLADKLTLDAEDKIRKIRLLEELERNLEGFAQSVKVVMKEAERGTLSGIHGPVSRILKVEDEYSVAIGTALGSSMQNIVVETEEDAKKAIMLLKRKGVGRSTFLPLSTIRGNKLSYDGIETCKGFIGLASDLCSCDPKYEQIIVSMLGRIVVVENIDCAIAMSKKFGYKFRVVTLDGQVINAGGSLTGGSVVKNSALLNRSIEIKNMTAEYEVLKEKAKDARILFRTVNEEVSKVESDFLSTQSELSLSREESFKVSAEFKRLSLEADSLKSRCENLEKEKEHSQSRIKNLTDEKENEELKYSELSKKIVEIESRIEVNSVSKDEFLKKREILSESIQKVRLDIFSDEKDIDSIKHEINSMIERQKGSEKKVTLFKEEIKCIEQKNEELRIQIENLEKESSDIKNQIKESEDEVASLNKQRMEIEKFTTDLRNSEREKTNEREIVSRELSKLEERKDNLQKEYDTIIAKLWDEYELTRSEACNVCERIENVNKANARLNELKNKIKNLGNINVGAIEEYKEVSERYEFMSDQVKDIEKSRDELRKLIADLTSQMKSLFVSKFNEITNNFKVIFKDLFGGGDAKLILSDPENVLTSGIEIEVAPPGKIVNRLEALSGGERALVAISLYFAIMQVNPPPFCVLDEIEAALDDVNVYRFASYLRKINSKTQFIAISHRRGTMEEADVLYGVTMQDEGVSKLLKLDAKEMEKRMKGIS